jgi:hypothetical protein
MEQKSKPAVWYFYNSVISHVVGVTEVLVLWQLVDRFQAFISLNSVKVYCYYVLSATCIQSLFYIWFISYLLFYSLQQLEVFFAV